MCRNVCSRQSSTVIVSGRWQVTFSASMLGHSFHFNAPSLADRSIKCWLATYTGPISNENRAYNNDRNRVPHEIPPSGSSHRRWREISCVIIHCSPPGHQRFLSASWRNKVAAEYIGSRGELILIVQGSRGRAEVENLSKISWTFVILERG